LGENFIEIYRKRTSKKSPPEVVLNYSAFFKDEFVYLKNIIQKQNEKSAEQDMPVGFLFRFNFIADIQRSFLRDLAKKVGKRAHRGKRAHVYAPLRRLNHWVVNPSLTVLYIDEIYLKVCDRTCQGEILLTYFPDLGDTPAPWCES
jgi:hypothetical protein